MTIYRSKQNREEEKDCLKTEEISRFNNIEDKFLIELSEDINDILQIPYEERRITRALFISSLKKTLFGNRKGLLFEYEQYLFDKASERIMDKFKLKSNVNYDYATHARFADIVDELEKKFKNDK